ncbi:TPA: hypothetical protein ACIRVE_005369 [Pseudomonas putida]
MRRINITIRRHEAYPESNEPSHFSPGTSGDGAFFEVADVATRCEVNRALTAWCDDVMLLEYWQDRRQGTFRVVDGDAPEAGACLSMTIEACGKLCQCKGSFTVTKG